MQVILSSKGQLVLPAAVRRRLKFKPRARLNLEVRDGGVFLRHVAALPPFEPIEYAPAGSLKLSKFDYALDKLAEETGPQDL